MRAIAVAGPLLLVGLIALVIWPPAARVPEVVRSYTQAPSPVERDSLAALKANGVAVRWRGTIAPVAVEVDGDVVRGTAGLAVAAPEGARVRVSDPLGVLDSGLARALRVHGALEHLTIDVDGERLAARLPLPGRKSIVVLGPAGWETRFLLQALEAHGVPTASRIRVGPRDVVSQGVPLPLDTARHSVVVLLGPVEPGVAGQVRGFVRAGSGLVLGAGDWGLGDLAPGRFGRAVRPLSSISLPASRADLVARPIADLRPGTARLDDGPNVRVAAWVVGAGRVVQLGDEGTWRLAMASEGGQAEHARLWLSAIATAMPRVPTRPIPTDEVAPRAETVAAFGESTNETASGLRDIDWTVVLGAWLLGVLVGEWAVRRVAGRP